MGTGVGGGARFRDRSPSVKRKAGEEHTPQGEDSDGFRKPGRPRQRKTANGTSQVQVDNVGEYPRTKCWKVLVPLFSLA